MCKSKSKGGSHIQEWSKINSHAEKTMNRKRKRCDKRKITITDTETYT